MQRGVAGGTPGLAERERSSHRPPFNTSNGSSKCYLAHQVGYMIISLTGTSISFLMVRMS